MGIHEIRGSAEIVRECRVWGNGCRVMGKLWTPDISVGTFEGSWT